MPTTPTRIRSRKTVAPGVRANFSPVVQKPIGYESNSNPSDSYVSIDNADSPYAASSGDYIIVDMSAGNVTVTLPASGRVSVSRDGAANTLTLSGTVNGEVNPEILFDGSCASMAYITEWRYV